MNTETMVAGRELDSEVAVKVVGLNVRGDLYYEAAHGNRRPIPRFSTNDADSLVVIAVMFAKGYACAIDIEGTPDAPVVGVMFHRWHGDSHDAEAATLPLAVCLASLVAMEGGEG